MSLIFILYILFIKVIDFHLLSYFALDFCIDILHTYIYHNDNWIDDNDDGVSMCHYVICKTRILIE